MKHNLTELNLQMNELKSTINNNLTLYETLKSLIVVLEEEERVANNIEEEKINLMKLLAKKINVEECELGESSIERRLRGILLFG